MTGITATQRAILEALATYRLCTAEQLHAIGVTKHLRHVYTVLGELCPKEREPSPTPRPKRRNLLISYLPFGNVTGRGSRADVWYLTRAGAKELAELRAELEPVKVPERIEPYPNEYKHRCDCVDFHIALRRFAEQAGVRVEFVHTYFGRGDERYRTRVSYKRDRRVAVIVPDAILQLIDERGVGRLYAFEMYEGDRTARATERILAYLDVIEQEAIEKAFGYGSYAAQVLVVFDTEAGERLVRERLAEHAEFGAFAQLFFFKTLPEVQAEFRSGWRQVGTDKPAALFGGDPR